MHKVIVERQAAAAEQAKHDLAQEAGKVFGKELKEVVSNAQLALAAAPASGRALAKLLDSTGLGSHPVLLRFLSDIGKETGGGSGYREY